MRNSEQGFALMAIVVFIAVIAFTVVIGESALLTKAVANQQEQERVKYVSRAKEQLENWYRQNLATIDANVSVPFSPEQILARSGVVPKWGVRLATSERLMSGGTAHHTIAVWLPRRNPDPSSMDTATGAFVPDINVPFAIVNGLELENAAIAATLRSMRQLALSLEIRFKAKTEMADDHSIDVNYFRPLDPTCVPQADEIPCLAGYVEGNTVDWRTIIGVDPARFTTAWGDSIQVSNTLDSEVAVPPFSMALRAVTPWGRTLQVLAVQPLG